MDVDDHILLLLLLVLYSTWRETAGTYSRYKY